MSRSPNTYPRSFKRRALAGVTGLAMLATGCSAGSGRRQASKAPIHPSGGASTTVPEFRTAEDLANDPVAVEAIAARLEQSLDKQLGTDSIVAEFAIGLCTIIGEPDAQSGDMEIDTVPGPILAATPSSADGGNVGMVVGYDPDTKKLVFGPAVVVRANPDGSAFLKQIGSSPETDFYDPGGEGIAQATLQVTPKGLVAGKNVVVATVEATGFAPAAEFNEYVNDLGAATCDSGLSQGAVSTTLPSAVA